MKLSLRTVFIFVGALLASCILSLFFLREEADDKAPYNASMPLHEKRLSFSTTWLSTPILERHRLIPFLLNEPAQRSQTYDSSNTLIEGISLADSQVLLGDADLELVRDNELTLIYDIGSIERDVFGSFISGIRKDDKLWLTFDSKSEMLKQIRTTN